MPDHFLRVGMHQHLGAGVAFVDGLGQLAHALFGVEVGLGQLADDPAQGLEARGGAVDARITSSGCTSGTVPTASFPSIRAISRSAAARPIASNGCRTVVSAGEA